MKNIVVILLTIASSASAYVPHQRLSFFRKTSNVLEAVRKEQDQKNDWVEQHLIHGAAEIHEDTNEELLEEENEAAWDAHDCSDPGVEAAMEERALMMAQKFAHDLKEKATHPEKAKPANAWNEEHLIHGVAELHEETDEELRESENDAAWDAHDCSDPGMEAAMEERALMLANEMAHKMKERAAAKKAKENGEKS